MEGKITVLLLLPEAMEYYLKAMEYYLNAMEYCSSAWSSSTSSPVMQVFFLSKALSKASYISYIIFYYNIKNSRHIDATLAYLLTLSDNVLMQHQRLLTLSVTTSLLRSTVLAFLRMFLHWSVILALFSPTLFSSQPSFSLHNSQAFARCESGTACIRIHFVSWIRIQIDAICQKMHQPFFGLNLFQANYGHSHCLLVSCNVKLRYFVSEIIPMQMFLWY